MATAKYKRNSRGLFETKVWDGTYTSNGAKHRITISTSKSSKELERLVNEHKDKLKNRSLVRQADMSFIEYARAWKIAYKSEKKHNTQAMYENIIEKHLIAVTCRADEVSHIHYMDVLSNTKGSRTKQQLAMTFRQIVRALIKDRYLPASALSDIFEDTIKVKYKPAEKRPLTDYEKKACFEATLDPQDQMFVYILFGCGLRRGEALALTKFDFNLERKELSVNKTVYFVKNNAFIGDTKNGVHRTVPIPDAIFPFVRQYILSMSGNNIFQMKVRDDLLTKSSYRKTWERIIKNLQAVSTEPIVGLTAHIFRHNYCSMLCYQVPKISIKKIAELMGDTEKMVLEVYNHIIQERERPAEIVSETFQIKTS